MNIQYHDIGFPFIEIENVYDEHELNLIWEELDFLCYSNKLKGPEETASAFSLDENQNKVLTKQNKGLFLDALYTDRDISSILTVNRKLFKNLDNIFLNSPSWFYKNCVINDDFTLVSYYETEDYYNKHKDNCGISVLTWFYKEPKKFEGGDLLFPDFDGKINVRNNHAVIFPGMINHSVTKVIMNDEDLNKKYGRFCMTQFLHFT